jgi:murein DD-endopeptidase MepM/ murein hydrolase activator NlpD
MAGLYRYNPHNCRYEPIVVTPGLFAKRTARFFLVCLAVAAVALAAINIRYPGWDEQLLAQDNMRLRQAWTGLMNELLHEGQVLAAIEHTDDQNYRTLLDLEPLPPQVRQAGFGGHGFQATDLPLIVQQTHDAAAHLLHRAQIQTQSLEQLVAALAEKEKNWASRPAIQPVSNEMLTRLHTTYGMRWNPGGFWRPHKGLDFSAPKGTPVYATGDGRVTEAHYSDSFGKVIYIDHGFGFETRYAHLSRFAVANGSVVQRGQVIGFVGNTGHSFGDHLHYEVLYRGMHVNPIHFFQRDLSQAEFERLIEVAGKSMTSLD